MMDNLEHKSRDDDPLACTRADFGFKARTEALFARIRVEGDAKVDAPVMYDIKVDTFRLATQEDWDQSGVVRLVKELRLRFVAP